LVNVWRPTINHDRELNGLLDSVSDFEWYKVSDKLVSKLVLQLLVFAVDRHFILQLIEIIVKVMLPVPFGSVRRRADFPTSPESLSSHIELNKLLKLIMSTPKSILEPSDCESLEN
jgi:hypothetical protein